MANKDVLAIVKKYYLQRKGIPLPSYMESKVKRVALQSRHQSGQEIYEDLQACDSNLRLDLLESDWRAIKSELGK